MAWATSVGTTSRLSAPSWRWLEEGRGTNVPSILTPSSFVPLADPASRTFRSVAAKSLYVSPFMPPDLDYAFAFTPPAGSLVAHMKAIRQGSLLFDATLVLERRPWNAAEIRRVLLRHPVMTASVMAGIHWQALKLWWKGVPRVPRVMEQ